MITFLKGNKRGITQVDWAISLAIFLLFLVWFFIFTKPLHDPNSDYESLAEIVLENFQKDMNIEQRKLLCIPKSFACPKNFLFAPKLVVCPNKTSFVAKVFVCPKNNRFEAPKNRIFFPSTRKNIEKPANPRNIYRSSVQNWFNDSISSKKGH